MIYRDYREAKATANREEQKLRVEVARNSIPYVNDITYPQDWKELEKRRQTGKVGADAVMAPGDAEVYKLLDTVVDLSQLTPDTPMGEALEVLARSVQPELPLFVNWGDLRNSALNQQSPINMQGLPRVRLAQGLEMLLSAVGGGFVELGYAVDNGLVVVATQLSLPKNLVTHVYQVGDILGAPVNVTFDDVEGSSSGGTSGGTGGTGGTGSTGSGGGSGSGTTSGGTSGGGTTSGGSSSSSSGSTSGGSSGDSALGSLDLTIPSEDLITAIVDATEQANWFDYGGDGTIRILGGNRLIVRQTPKIHSEIAEILDNLRRHLGEQIAIEARFLLVDEKYIEDIGLDLDFSFSSSGKLGIVDVEQGSADVTAQSDISSHALTTSGTYGGIMDDLQVKFLLRATQQNANSLVFTAPKVTVLSNETAGIRVTREQTYTSGYDSMGSVATAGVVTQATIVPVIDIVQGGVALSVTPTISQDKKYVLLNVRTSLGDFSMSDAFLPYLGGQEAVSLFKYQQPLVDNTSIETRVYVPDKGTLLIGGQKIKRHSEIESGVPVLSKIPYLGRAFSNRSKSEETKVLLILVRPTIIFTTETEADHVSSLSEAMPAFR
jgi:type II secretory pathway component GspD/PulD (secretin)